MSTNAETPRRRMVQGAANGQPTPRITFTPTEDDDSDEAGGMPHTAQRAVAMFPVLWDCWADIAPEPIAKLDEMLAAYDGQIARFRVVLHKHTTPEGSSKRGWLVVGSYEKHTDCTIEAIRRMYGPGQYRAALWAVVPDASGNDSSVWAIGFGFGIVAPLAAPEQPPAPPPAYPAAPAAQPFASPFGFGGGFMPPMPTIPGMPPMPPPQSFQEWQAAAMFMQQWQAQQKAIKDAETAAAAEAVARDQRQKLAEIEFKKAMAAIETEAEAREERRADRVKEKKREDAREQEQDDDRRARRAHELVLREMELSSQKRQANALDPVEDITSKQETLEKLKEIFGAGKEKEDPNGIARMVLEAFKPHAGDIMKIGSAWLSDRAKLQEIEMKLNAELADRENARAREAAQRARAMAVAAPPPPPPQHVDTRIEVKQTAAPAASPADAWASNQRAVVDAIAPNAPPIAEPAASAAADPGDAPPPSVAAESPPPADASQDGSATVEAGALSPEPESAAPEEADDDEDDDEGCPECEPCPHEDDDECDCPRCPHGYAEGDDQ